MNISSPRLSLYHFTSLIKNPYFYYFHPLLLVSSNFMAPRLSPSSVVHKYHRTNQQLARSNTIHRYSKNSLYDFVVSFRQAWTKKLPARERGDP
jgi:hypothetical protein